ncbi:MAG: hypothetical protein GWO07_00200 [Candidatus Dadabacteria bacterium]|nr:hypothetical protein [Candidatus Dadabacteria bacterium]NIV43271.1 hypothetical protein [Candidatus Dadabacteria bacterium]NIX14343.1 hypothetical protein [Candidatus Dadabacteria bacterium]
MSYRAIKWTIFITLFLTLSAIFFLVQVVMFFPAVFFIAGILYLIPKTIINLGAYDTLTFLIIITIHFLIYFGIYYLISFVAATLISRIESPKIKNAIVGCIVAGLVVLTQFMYTEQAGTVQ